MLRGMIGPMDRRPEFGALLRSLRERPDPPISRRRLSLAAALNPNWVQQHEAGYATRRGVREQMGPPEHWTIAQIITALQRLDVPVSTDEQRQLYELSGNRIPDELLTESARKGDAAAPVATFGVGSTQLVLIDAQEYERLRELDRQVIWLRKHGAPVRMRWPDGRISPADDDPSGRSPDNPGSGARP